MSMQQVEWRTIEELKGHTLTAISIYREDDDEIRFHRSDGKTVLMHHHQDCCECVVIEDVDGDLSDLVGSEILEAEEAWREKSEEELNSYWDDSATWTFYKLGTKNGSVSIRWLGESNGYYSESVDIDVVD